MSPSYDLVCLSHLRWDYVWQRPQHLLSRAAKERRVFFVEEPLLGGNAVWLEVSPRQNGLYVVVPHRPEGLRAEVANNLQRQLLDDLMAKYEIHEYALWYYSPLAVSISHHLRPAATVYDCMDELSAFKGAPPALRERERELFGSADLVFTGGQSLYEAKCHQHPRVYAFPSSVDTTHFAQARGPLAEPADQSPIPHPRLGFYGVIDERMDLDLLAGVAEAHPDWHLVLLGPVTKVDPKRLPRHANIHYLGSKSYEELPAYLATWDVALLPFALNESTRFISPTTTPEYLAAGRPVVSTPIRDVVRPYGEKGLVRIAATSEEFVAACEAALEEDVASRLPAVDAFLAQTSWDRTWTHMRHLLDATLAVRRTPTPLPAALLDAVPTRARGGGVGIA